jgi:hypothetical protein
MIAVEIMAKAKPQPDIEATLLARVEAFLEATGETATHFGRRVMKDPMFMNRLRGGRRLFAETVQKIEAAIAPKEGKRESRDSRKSQAAGAMRSTKRGRNGRGLAKGQNAVNR